MPAEALYQKIKGWMDTYIDQRVDRSSRERISLYVTGVLEARNGSPAQVAKALARLGLAQGKAESLERRIRRMENDGEITAEYCFHPVVKACLAHWIPEQLILIVDPTLQEDRLVMLSVNSWYRGRSLPLAWTLWPANRPLEGERFWARVKRLLALVAELLPTGVPVIVVADRAFGTPAFTDLVETHGWDWLVRVQTQTVYRDRQGQEAPIGELVRYRNQRKKLRGYAFKKQGWRAASVVVYWGRRHKKALCLVSSCKPGWELIRLYRQRFPIEGTFRDYKAYGWRWEQGQVMDQDHMERLLVGMALATWIALLSGTWRAKALLAQVPTGRRHSRPYEAKLSLFHLGLDLLAEWFYAPCLPAFVWLLCDWQAGNWSEQLRAHHARAKVFAL